MHWRCQSITKSLGLAFLMALIVASTLTPLCTSPIMAQDPYPVTGPYGTIGRTGYAQRPTTRVGISEVVEKARAGMVSHITVKDGSDEIIAEYKDGSTVAAVREHNASMLDYLVAAGVSSQNMPELEVQQAQTDPLGGFLPLLIIGAVFVLILFGLGMRGSGSSAGSIEDRTMSFSKSRARVFIGTRPN
ncbi:MAG: hypothetical protein ACUVX1_17285, partial [Chloroflexota bacterium]